MRGEGGGPRPSIASPGTRPRRRRCRRRRKLSGVGCQLSAGPAVAGDRTRHLVAPLPRCLVAYQGTSAFLIHSLSSHTQECQTRVCKTKVWHPSAGAAANAFFSAAPGSVWQPLAMLISSACAPADRFAGSGSCENHLSHALPRESVPAIPCAGTNPVRNVVARKDSRNSGSQQRPLPARQEPRPPRSRSLAPWIP